MKHLHIKYVLRWIFLLWVLSGVDNLWGQYRISVREAPAPLTDIITVKNGMLLYGDAKGDIGYFDGLVFDKRQRIPGKINKIKRRGAEVQIYSDHGYYVLQDENLKLKSGDIQVLDGSPEGDLLITRRGIYSREGQEYVPEKWQFYDISHIDKGEYISQGENDFMLIDRILYVKVKEKWKELFVKSGIDIFPYADHKIMIKDDRTIISLTPDGYLDTLLSMDRAFEFVPVDHGEYLVETSDSLFHYFQGFSKRRFVGIVPDIKLSNAVKDQWGSIWIASGNRLLSLIDDVPLGNLPKMEITDIMVNGKPVDATNVRISKNDDILVRYRGIFLPSPTKIKYQYRVSENNGDNIPWSASSRKTFANVRNLSPGKYAFEARATIDGKYFSYAPPVIIKVSDNKFLWILLSILGGALLVFLTAVFFNVKYNRFKEENIRKRKILIAEKEKLIQKNEILELRQKSLQLQMNPHFIFNALNSIQGLIAIGDDTKARNYLRAFSLMMRSVLNQSRSQYISIEDEVKYLTNYLSLEKMANGDSFDYEVIVDLKVDENIFIPNMLIQPFVENAIIHGVKPLQNRKGKITVHFFVESELVRCVVEDNGVGRKKAKTQQRPGHKSVALEVVVQRLSFVQNKYGQNPVVFEDIYDDSGNACGTKVTILLPVINSER